jgi:hypothetical protein
MGRKRPLTVTLRLVKTPQPATLSPRERAELVFAFVFIGIPASFLQIGGALLLGAPGHKSLP